MADHSPTPYKRQLGMALERLRKEAKRTREEAADLLRCSPSKISRIEGGNVGVRHAELRDLLDFYGAAGQERAEIEELGREAGRRRPRTSYGSVIPDWFRKYVHLEEAAREVLVYDGELIPGLLQTEAYARAVTMANPLHRPGDVDRLIQARMARQARLTVEEPMHLHAVLGESAVRALIGGAAVMKEQLGHLRAMTKRSNVTVQVIPFEVGAHAATGFPFILLRFADHGQDVAYLENITAASYVVDPTHVASYDLVFRHVLMAALSPSKTLALLDTVAAEL